MDSTRTAFDRFIDIAILLAILPNLANRDDTGKPKTAYFGGIERLSPSSQFLKRAWRRACLNASLLIRSKYVPEMIFKRLVEQGLNLTDEQKETVTKVLWEKMKKVGKTEGLLFLSNSEIDKIADIMAEEFTGTKRDAKAFGKAIESVYAGIPLVERLSLSLYGRMFAGANTSLNAMPDGALQVCKALSTTRVRIATDYFTAMDDYRQDSDDEELAAVGGSHIGERMFAPGCNLLIQFRIDMKLLCDNAGLDFDNLTDENRKDIVSVVSDLLNVAIFRPLSGAAAQGSYAMSARPFYAAVQVPKRGSLYDLAGAFIAPKGRDASIEDDVKTLRAYMAKAEAAYSEVEAKAEFCMDPEMGIEGAYTTKESYTEAIETLILQSLHNA